MMPARPATRFVFVQAALALGRLEVLLDRPAAPGDFRQARELDGHRGVEPLILVLRFLAERPANQKTLKRRGGNALLEKPGDHLRVVAQPKLTTAYPTAGRCLKAISRMEITATRVESGEEVQWHLTDLPPLLKRIIQLLHLSPTLYTRLTKAAA
jgi:hypothetical protein